MFCKSTFCRTAAVGTLLVTAFGFAADPRPRGAAPLSGLDIVDLTHTLREGVPIFPGGEPFKITKLADLSQGYYLNKFCMGEHCGTHVDAPLHFARGGKSVDELPLTQLIGPLVVIDVEKEAAADPDLTITA